MELSSDSAVSRSEYLRETGCSLLTCDPLVADYFLKWYRDSIRSNSRGKSVSQSAPPQIEEEHEAAATRTNHVNSVPHSVDPDPSGGLISDSLALSSAQEWGYEKTRLWEHEDSTSEKEIPTRRRSSTISLKDVNSRTTQLVFGMQDGKRVPKLKEPRSLYCVPRDVVMPRWPVGIDTVCPKPDLTHNNTPPPFNEEFYKRPSGANLRLLEKTDTDKHEGTVVYHLPLMRFPFYTRSRPTAALEPCPFPLSCYDDDVLRFESRFECANLFRARRVGPYEYELELRWDYFTMKHTQWFYFRVSNTKAGPTYKFTIINLLKSGSLYNEGMKPLFYSERNAKNKNLGWLRMGHNIHYYKNNIRRKDCKGERYQYSLTWQFQFPYTSDVCYFSHCYPYSYTDLQKDLLEIANDAVKSQYVKQRILCHSLGGNMVHLLTVTTPSTHLTEAKQKRAVVVTARVHPGETNSSYMMRGFINFITGSSPDAKVLRDNFVFKIVPMLNPDGVIVGNYRSSLAARDLNRNYKNPIKDAYPSIWSVKAMIRRMLTEREVVLYCDLHGHSRKMNVFMYGCENKDPGLRLQERVFPNMMSRNTSKFKYSSCRFKVQKKKEGTGRIVMWQQMGILNSFTMEATFAGYNNVHFNSRDLEDMGYHFCDTLLDYCDPDTSKVEHVLANLTRIVMSQYAAKIGKSIEDLKDLPLEDLDISDLESSDGGSDSSVSDGPPKLPLLRKKCASLQSKKKYKTRKERNQIHRQSKRRNSKQTSEPAKSKAHSVAGESSTNKEEKPAKPKLERRCSISSAESPSTLAKQAHGIPKHAQERIEERQAKVNKGPTQVYPNVGETAPAPNYLLSEDRTEHTPPVGAIIPQRRAPTWVRRTPRHPPPPPPPPPPSQLSTPANTTRNVNIPAPLSSRQIQNINYYYHIPTLGLTFSTLKVTPHLRISH